MPKPSPLLENLAALVEEAVTSLPEATNYSEAAIAFFDLVGSTQRKIEEGHRSGTTAALQHNAIVGSIAAKFNGTVVKSLGDGLLVSFPSSRDAALAALNAVAALAEHTDLQTKIGLTVGAVARLTVLGVPDIAGAAVDRCARLQALANAGEIVIDEPFADSVKTHLSDFDGIVLPEATLDVLKGIGEVRVRRLSVGK